MRLAKKHASPAYSHGNRFVPQTCVVAYQIRLYPRQRQYREIVVLTCEHLENSTVLQLWFCLPQPTLAHIVLDQNRVKKSLGRASEFPPALPKTDDPLHRWLSI